MAAGDIIDNLQESGVNMRLLACRLLAMTQTSPTDIDWDGLKKDDSWDEVSKFISTQIVIYEVVDKYPELIPINYRRRKYYREFRK